MKPPETALSSFEGRQEDWDALLAGAGRTALEQSWAYGEAVAKRHGWIVRRLLAGPPGTPEAVLQMVERPVLGLVTLVRLTRGPVLLPPAPEASRREAIFRAIRRHSRLSTRRPLFWMPALRDSETNLALMRRCGLRRSVTGYTTAWLDLGRSEPDLRRALHGKFRNSLAAAEAGALTVGGGHAGALDWLLERHDEHRRARRFVAPDGLFYRYLTEAAGQARTRVYQAYSEDLPVSGALFLRHGACATYAVGWSGADGRRLGAQTLLLWRALLDLKRRGVTWLDLGGLTPAAPGVARFKLGLGGEPVTLAGTFF